MKVEFGRMLRELDYLTELRVALWKRVRLRDDAEVDTPDRVEPCGGEDQHELPGRRLPSYWTAETTESSAAVVVNKAQGACKNLAGTRPSVAEPGDVDPGTSTGGRGEVG